MKNWHEKDEFWETMAPFMFGEESWERAPAEIEQVLALLGFEPGTAILDLCCGPGRHTLELARHGYHVVGVDRTAAYLEKARQLAENESLEVEFIQADMRAFMRPDAFDGVLSIFTTFSYFENPDENQQVLVNAYSSLKPGGALFIDTMGKEVLARIFQPRDWNEQDGAFFLQDRQVSRDWSWIEDRWIVLDGVEKHEFLISHWLYSAAELRSMLKEAGFGSVEIYGDLDGSPYDHTARRLVSIARK